VISLPWRSFNTEFYVEAIFQHRWLSVVKKCHDILEALIHTRGFFKAENNEQKERNTTGRK